MDGLTVDTSNAVQFSSSNVRLHLFETDTTNLNTELMNQSGKFWINTIPDDASSAKVRLSVDHASGDISFYEDTGSSPKFLWDSSLEMAIIGDLNTTAYGGGLVVATPTGSHISVADSGSGERLHLEGGSGSATVGSKSNHPLQFITNDTLAVTIDTSQNLLVGTTGATLPENGTTSAHVGVSLDASNYVASARYQNIAGYFNRIGNDGDIISFRKDGSSVGSIGSISGTGVSLISTTGTVQVGSSNAGFNFNGAGNYILPWNVGANTSNDGGVALGAASHRFLNIYLSGGVYLGGTTSANFLDDYEEGEFNATAGPQTSGTTPLKSTFDRLSYTKIGRLVHIQGVIEFDTSSSPVGDFINLSSLPFTIADLTEGAGRASGHVTLVDAGTFTSAPTLGLEGGTQLRVYMDASNITINDQFYCSFSYFTT